MAFADTFKALSDPTRREILTLLKKGNLTAGEICGHFDVSGATISHHLAVLKKAGLVEDRKEGKYIYYELNLTVFQEMMAWIQAFMKEGEDERN